MLFRACNPKRYKKHTTYNRILDDIMLLSICGYLKIIIELQLNYNQPLSTILYCESHQNTEAGVRVITYTW